MVGAVFHYVDVHSRSLGTFILMGAYWNSRIRKSREKKQKKKMFRGKKKKKFKSKSKIHTWLSKTQSIWLYVLVKIWTSSWFFPRWFCQVVCKNSCRFSNIWVKHSSLGKKVQNILIWPILVFEINSKIYECLLSPCPRNSISDLSGNVLWLKIQIQQGALKIIQTQVAVLLVGSLEYFFWTVFSAWEQEPLFICG